jgi:hypothetical protein
MGRFRNDDASGPQWRAWPLVRRRSRLAALAWLTIGRPFVNRLRCPRCGAVGTWKPREPVRDERSGAMRPFRWLCKWCGYYDGPEGQKQCCVDTVDRVWKFSEEADTHLTPRRAVRQSAISNAWPWR